MHAKSLKTNRCKASLGEFGKTFDCLPSQTLGLDNTKEDAKDAQARHYASLDFESVRTETTRGLIETFEICKHQRIGSCRKRCVTDHTFIESLGSAIPVLLLLVVSGQVGQPDFDGLNPDSDWSEGPHTW